MFIVEQNKKIVLNIQDTDIERVVKLIRSCYPDISNDIVARSLAESESMTHVLILVKALYLMLSSPHFYVEFGFATACELLVQVIEQINQLMNERPILRQELLKQGIAWPGLENNT